MQIQKLAKKIKPKEKESVNGQDEDKTMSDLPASSRQIWPRSNQLLSNFVEMLSVKCEWRWLRLLVHTMTGEKDMLTAGKTNYIG